MNSITYPKIRQKTIVTQVMEKIREFIASGTVKPGDRLPTESQLAQMFGVGRSSIREAVKVFNYLGVLESQTRKGTVLCEHSRISREALTWSFLLGKKDIRDLMDLRMAIEQECWFQLALAHERDPVSVGNVLERLDSWIAKMETALKNGMESELVEADFNFHLTAIEYSGNEQFIALFQTLQSFTCEEIRASNIFRKNSDRIVEEHAEFVGALRADDRSRLINLYRIHIANAKERVLHLDRKA